MKFKSRVWVCRNHSAGAGKRFFKINTALKKKLSIYKCPPDSFSDQGRIGLEYFADLRQSHNDPRKQNLAGKLPVCLRFPLPLNQRKARLAEGQVVLPKFLLLLVSHQRHLSDSYPKIISWFVYIPKSQHFFFHGKNGVLYRQMGVLYRQFWPNKQQALSAFARSCVEQK